MDDPNFIDFLLSFEFYKASWFTITISYTYCHEQVGEAGPILDAMAVMLENISSITVVSRATVTAVYRTAQIVASLPNLSYKSKARSGYSWCIYFLSFFAGLRFTVKFTAKSLKPFFYISGIPWDTVSSTTSKYGSSGLWNTGRSSPNLLCCFSSNLCVSSFVFVCIWPQRYSTNTLQSRLCFLFFSCLVSEAKTWETVFKWKHKSK